MLRTVLAAAAAILLAPVSQAHAQAAEREQVAAAPSDFVTKAGSIGMAEVAMGELGIQKARSPQVQEYARHMIEDHGRNNQKLQAAAAAAGQTLPTAPTDAEREALARLQTLPAGQEFDRAYMEQMVKDHQKAIDLYRSQAQAGQSPQLQAYAQQTLPALQQHLQMAQSLAGTR